MHPPLEVHQHPACKDVILALKKCHKEHPVAKFWGVCNDAALALNICFKGEKAAKRAANKERIVREQERLRARIAARRAEEAAKSGGEAAPVGSGELPGFSAPKERGIPEQQQQPAPL